MTPSLKILNVVGARPNLTLRENAEGPATISEGTNLLAGTDPAKIVAARDVLAGKGKAGKIPPLWDGQAAGRIVTKSCCDWGPAKSTLIDSNNSGTCGPKGLAPLASFLYSDMGEYRNQSKCAGKSEY